LPCITGASGTHIKTNEWVEGFFSVSNGGIFTVAFETYGDIYYLKPSVVAIDDVSFREGESCPVIQGKYCYHYQYSQTCCLIYNGNNILQSNMSYVTFHGNIEIWSHKTGGL
jgi:hypothetical protein